MLKKIGYIVKVTARNKEYYYLRKAYRENGVKKAINLYCFGTKEKALKDFSEWKDDIRKMPAKLSRLGYNEQDIIKWQNKIKTL